MLTARSKPSKMLRNPAKKVQRACVRSILKKCSYEKVYYVVSDPTHVLQFGISGTQSTGSDSLMHEQPQLVIPTPRYTTQVPELEVFGDGGEDGQPKQG